MAIQSSSSGARNGGGFRRRHRPVSDINVTPLVDVMLVLLVVFMVTAPLLTVGVQVDLPRTKARSLPQDAVPLAVSIKENGTIFLMDEEIPFEELASRLQAIAATRPDDRIYVRGDAKVEYGRIAEVMGVLNNAGFAKVALVTETLRPDKQKK